MSTAEKLEKRSKHLKTLMSQASKDFRKRDLKKQYKRLKRRLLALKKQSNQKDAAKADS